MPNKLFEDRIQNEFLPLFCDHPARAYEVKGFKPKLECVTAMDAENFLAAIDQKLVTLRDKLYFAPMTSHGEQLFNEGEAAKRPRPIYLALEVVISIATVSRLHKEFGWPSKLIGTQSKVSAFDVMAFPHADATIEHVACEIKSTKSGTDRLISLMKSFGSDASVVATNAVGDNALKKVKALRARKPPIFWALGPGGYGTVFKMSYAEDDSMQFRPTSSAALRYPGADQLQNSK